MILPSPTIVGIGLSSRVDRSQGVRPLPPEPDPRKSEPGGSELAVEALLELDPVERAKQAARLMDEHRAAISELAVIRSDALAEARRGGLSTADMAKRLGVTRQQVHRLLGEGEHLRTEPPFSQTDVIKVARAAGWVIETNSNRRYLRLRCSCGKHVTWIHSTPSNSHYFPEGRLCAARVLREREQRGTWLMPAKDRNHVASAFHPPNVRVTESHVNVDQKLICVTEDKALLCVHRISPNCGQGTIGLPRWGSSSPSASVW